MSIAREPGRLRGGDGRARRIGWAVGVGALVAAVLLVVAQLATAPAPPTAPTAHPARAAGTVQAAESTALDRARTKQVSDTPVARVEIQERRLPVRPPRPQQPATTTAPAAEAEGRAEVEPSAQATATAASPPRAAPRPQAKPAPRPAATAQAPPAVARKPERSIEPVDSPLEPEERPDARYPESAAAAGVTGKVRLKVIVDPRGQVEDALVVRSSGDDRLDQAAEEAVRRWRYRPARRAGQAVTATDYVEVEFYREPAATPED